MSEELAEEDGEEGIGTNFDEEEADTGAMDQDTIETPDFVRSEGDSEIDEEAKIEDDEEGRG